MAQKTTQSMIEAAKLMETRGSEQKMMPLRPRVQPRDPEGGLNKHQRNQYLQDQTAVGSQELHSRQQQSRVDLKPWQEPHLLMGFPEKAAKS